MAGHSRRAARALQKLTEEDPALGALALWCRHLDTDADPMPDSMPEPMPESISAAAPASTSGETIRYGPGFEALQTHEQVGLAAHHILHVAFRHSARTRAMQLRLGERFDRDAYNIAADAIVNETLLKAGYALPRPAIALTPLLQGLGLAADMRAQALGRLDADALYVLLIHDPRGASPDGAGAADDAEARARKVREAGAEMGHVADLEANGADGAGDAGGDPGDDGEKDTEWRQRLAVALEQGRLAGRGIGALGFRLSDLPEAATPWETVLRGLVTKALTRARHPDFRRPARRWLAMDADARRTGTAQPVFEPAVRMDQRIPRIVVGLDSSGSIDRDRLAIFAAQVVAIARRTRAVLHLMVFDEEVRSDLVLSGAEMAQPDMAQPGLTQPGLSQSIEQVAFSRDGGTSFVDVIERAAALDPSVIVVLTDLEGPFGSKVPACPVIWAVPFVAGQVPPFGRVLNLSV